MWHYNLFSLYIFPLQIFRKEPFFYGYDNHEQLVKIAKVVLTFSIQLNDVALLLFYQRFAFLSFCPMSYLEQGAVAAFPGFYLFSFLTCMPRKFMLLSSPGVLVWNSKDMDIFT